MAGTHMVDLETGVPMLIQGYLRSISATSFVEFACATMAAEAWVKMLYFARFALSAAISTSSIRPIAARMLVSIDDNASAEKLSLVIPPPT